VTPLLAYSSNAYRRTDLPSAIARVAALGYPGIELMADAPHLWPPETTSRIIDETRRRLGQSGLTVSNVNAFMMNKIGDARNPYWYPSWIEPSRAYRRVRIEHTLAALEMARALMAPNITTEPGGPIEPGAGYKSAFNLFVEELKPVVERAEKLEVRLLVEPEPGLLIERFEQYLELAERIDSPFLGLNFDIGHAYCAGQEPWDWIEPMAPHTRHYHIEDIAASRVHQHLVPGDGAIDFAATLSAIARTGYRGWLTVELYPYLDDPDDAGRRALEHLTRVAAST
jgi:sugar phosphate isomerase/epimerase